MGFHLCLPKAPQFCIPPILSHHPFPAHTHPLISCLQAAIPLTLAVRLGGAPLALITDATGAAHQMEVRVTTEIHPGSI